MADLMEKYQISKSTALRDIESCFKISAKFNGEETLQNRNSTDPIVDRCYFS